MNEDLKFNLIITIINRVVDELPISGDLERIKEIYETSMDLIEGKEGEEG